MTIWPLPADVRHDIVHHMPRSIADKGNVPSWLQPLAKQDLFVSLPRSYTLDDGTTHEVDLVFADKLPSYALAYWGFELAERAAVAFADNVRPAWAGYVGSLQGELRYVPRGGHGLAVRPVDVRR